MSLYDDVLLMTAQEKMFSGVEGELLDKLIDLTLECDIDLDAVSLEFKDPDFLNGFFKLFSEEEQKKYLSNSYNYEHNQDYDTNYLLVFRRAIYTEYEKNENFWSTSYDQVKFGLKQEQPIGSPVRLYSSIMVTTMAKLMNHGLVDLEHGGATDGEISIDGDKPFNDFLFVYKPSDEMESLRQYISSGGMSYDEVVSYLEHTSEERKKAQGYTK